MTSRLDWQQQANWRCAVTVHLSEVKRLNMEQLHELLDEMESKFPRKTTPKVIKLSAKTYAQLISLLPTIRLAKKCLAIEGLPFEIADMKDGVIKTYNLDDEVMQVIEIPSVGGAVCPCADSAEKY